MSTTVANVSLAVNLAAISGNVYINLPATSGISQDGYWFYYKPTFANNTVYGANVVPYHWGTALNLVGSATELSMEGTTSLITEPYYGANIQYHGSAIEWIGPGTNDITSTQEADAFFFGHLGSLSPATDDDAFYWDRIFTDSNGTEWDYYQYHKHLPLFYPQFENGRQTMSARGYINPEDKAYGWMITTRVSVMGVDYSSIVARIHTPSVGGAHNSHNDVTLPTVSTKNYIPGGILRGLGNRFHAFYIAANGSQWDVFVRTYTQASLSFGVESTIGQYDLADPTQNTAPTVGAQYNYPVRASAGTAYDQRIYFPVLFANVSVASNFDLKIWSFNSLDTIAGGSLQQFTLVSNVTIRPDCHLKVLGANLYAIHSNISSGGVTLQSYNGNVWTQIGNVVTNGSSQYVRVHGLEYNSADTKFYTLLSGNVSGSGNTYVGRGLYSFEVTGLFSGYPHLDYDFANNALISRPALTSGYLEYSQVDATFTKYTTNEPAGIAQGTNVLEFVSASPKFINRHESILGGDEFYYQGIELRDGRKMFVGRITSNDDNFSTISTSGDFLVSLYASTGDDPHHFAWGGSGDDYITGCWEDAANSRVWITGYTKSELVEKRDMKIHGFCRTFSDATSQIEFADVAVDTTGNIYVAGNHDTGYVIVTKFNYNYDQVWQTSLNPPGNSASAFGITIGTDDEHIYICGKTNGVVGNREDAFIAKMMTDVGDTDYVTLYKDGANANVYASSIDIITNSNSDRIVSSIVKGNTTTIISASIGTGAIVEQNTLEDFVVNRLRYDSGYANVGQFIMAGNDGAVTSNAKFGMGRVEDQTSMFKWLRTYGNVSQSDTFNDIVPLGSNVYVMTGNTGNSAVAVKATVTGTYTVTKDWAKTFANASFNSSTVIDGNIIVAGYTTKSDILNMGMDDALLARFTSAGDVSWQNAFGHDMPERFSKITNDVTGDNFITVGWSESHSSGRDGVIFRGWKEGFGTGTYHLAENPGIPYYYLASNLAVATDATTITSISAPLNSAGNLSAVGGVFTTFTGDTYTLYNQGTNNYVFDGGGFANVADPTLILARGGTYTFNNTTASHPFWIKTQFATGNTYAYNTGVTNNGGTSGNIVFAVPEDAPDQLVYACGNHSGMRGNINIVNNPSLYNGFTTFDYQYSSNFYDGSFGPNGVFMFFLGYIDLNEVQDYLNSATHKERSRQGIRVEYTDSFFHFWQAGTVGDGSADDGNIFGYDIILHSNGSIYAIGQTSGDLSQTNLGASGVYDYVLFEFDPATGELEPYQNGTALDEETYALTELADGRIAYTGRTSGNLGGVNQGGYDIFLGIFDTNTEISDYYSIGSGLDDKGVNVHDLGGNVLAITYSTYGLVGNAATQFGTEDIGVIQFNYVTDTWGNAYQTGSTTSEFFEQNGKPSTLTPDGRIGVVCSSAGNFADDAVTFGLLDICLGVLDLNTGTWQKYQIGSSASDFASSIFGDGDRFLIAGYTRATFADGDSNAIWVEFDALKGIGAKSEGI